MYEVYEEQKSLYEKTANVSKFIITRYFLSCRQHRKLVSHSLI